MFEHGFAFDSVGYLALLALLPIMWWLSFNSLAGLGRWRRIAVLTLRSLVLTIIVLALADMQYQRRSDQLTVVYLLDQSLSIPVDQRQAMIDYVNDSIEEHFEADENRNRYAVIVFGRDASVEMPLVNAKIPLSSMVETILDPEYTDIATAIQRAQAMFPYDSAKRVVLVTDGNQNVADAQREARSAAASGVSIDVIPVMLSARSEVSVEKVDLPASARKGQPFEMRVVLRNDAPEGSNQTIPGKLVIKRNDDFIVEQEIEVPPGRRVFTIPDEIYQPDFYTYEARFSPLDSQSDGMTQNNQASAFTHVRGKGSVLLIENWDTPGQFDYLIERLRDEEIEVTVRPSDQPFTSLAELQRFDTVVLANVSRSTGTSGDNVSSFSDEQIQMLVRNTREMGCGLVMMGGPDTFGAGGWTNTELEKAMPVDFEIKSAKVSPVGALVLMMHAGEMPKANYWQKRIASESIKMLGSRDYCGMVFEWGGTDQWLWGRSQGGIIRVGPNRKKMLGRVQQMTIGDMPAFDPGLKMAAISFGKLPDAAVKHMIIISDGDPTPASASTLNSLAKQGVKVSTVAVGSHGTIGSSEMQRIAKVTGGKYYVVKSANALPKIYQKETRQIARPLVYEPKSPVQPAVVSQHEIVEGLEGGLPPISGFVLTTIKENPLVEVIARSPLPLEERNATVLASWTYGAGKAVALTTDAGNRWANSWTEWDNYDKLFSQMIRWSMRPTNDMGNFSVATNVKDGKTQVIITALDQDEQFLNDLSMSGTVVSPTMQSIDLQIEQTAPGRYVGEFASEESGTYLIGVNPGGDHASIRTGVNVGYSAEYRDIETNLPLLETLASLPAKDGPPGNFVQAGLDGEDRNELLASNPFRRDLAPAIANQPIWPWLLIIGSCVFFTDVFVRRVQIQFDWFMPMLARARDYLLRRESAAPVQETMSRLRTKKKEIGEQLDRGRTSARFEPSEAASDETPTVTVTPTPKAKPQRPQQSAEEPEERPAQESYTERLLKAKRKVWDERGDDPKKKS